MCAGLASAHRGELVAAQVLHAAGQQDDAAVPDDLRARDLRGRGGEAAWGRCTHARARRERARGRRGSARGGSAVKQRGLAHRDNLVGDEDELARATLQPAVADRMARRACAVDRRLHRDEAVARQLAVLVRHVERHDVRVAPCRVAVRLRPHGAAWPTTHATHRAVEHPRAVSDVCERGHEGREARGRARQHRRRGEPAARLVVQRRLDGREVDRRGVQLIQQGQGAGGECQAESVRQTAGGRASGQRGSKRRGEIQETGLHSGGNRCAA